MWAEAEEETGFHSQYQVQCYYTDFTCTKGERARMAMMAGPSVTTLCRAAGLLLLYGLSSS